MPGEEPNKIWRQAFTLEGLNELSRNTMVEHIGIRFSRFGPDFLSATMPVDDRTVQPMRLLHGGANVVLAETVGSMASALCLEDLSSQQVVGLEVNANHLLAVRSGLVTGTCRPIRLGRKIHVWEIRITDEKERLSCISRLTMAVIDKRD